MRLKIRSYPIHLIPTKIENCIVDERIEDCVKAILKIAKVPGFTYSKRGIINEVKRYGFTRSEINEALKRLEGKGFLKRE